MNLVTLIDAAKKHDLKYVTLLGRLKRSEIKPIKKQGRNNLFNYEDIKNLLNPIDDEFQAQRIKQYHHNQEKMAGFEHNDDSLSKREFFLFKQEQKNRLTISSLSVYG